MVCGKSLSMLNMAVRGRLACHIQDRKERDRMQDISELDLPNLAMEELSFAENPYPHFVQARKEHPWLASSSLGFVVTNYQGVRDLMAMDGQMRTPFDHIIELMAAKGTSWGRFQETHILSRSGPEHKRLRDILASAFTPRRVNQYRPLMREVISGLLDEWAPKGAFDFEEFASHFPITVMCRLIGGPPEMIPSLRSSLEAMGMSISMNPGLLPKLEAAIETMDVAVHELIASRESSWQPDDDGDMLDLLLQAKTDGGLTLRELSDILIFLLVAGFDTSKNMLTLIMYELVDRPEEYGRCAVDLEFCGKVFDETMRIHGAATTSREVIDAITYRDVRIPVGSILWFPWAIIGRDPASAEDPDRFDPERERENPHVGFGLGPHICLGKFMGRALLSEGLHLIAQRVIKPRSPGPLGWRPFPGTWGIAGLPVEFELA